jgi:hypothetical protein
LLQYCIEKIFSSDYDLIYRHGNKYLTGRRCDGKILWGLLDSNGGVILPCKYQSGICAEQKVIIFSENDCEGMMDFEENISNNDLKIIKLMLKYLKKDLHNWVYLDNALSNKIPSYRHSLQRRDLIEYLEMNLTSLSNVNQNKYNQIKLEINSSPNESYIDLTDEIIENDLENYVKLPSCSIDMWIK